MRIGAWVAAVGVVLGAACKGGGVDEGTIPDDEMLCRSDACRDAWEAWECCEASGADRRECERFADSIESECDNDLPCPDGVPTQPDPLCP